MRIGVLSLPLHANYGGILQAYALQQALGMLGHEAVCIDQPSRISLPPRRWLTAYPKRFLMKYLLGHRDWHVNYEAWYNEHYPDITRHTSRFIDQHIRRRIIRSVSDLDAADFDALVVGSDQIWRRLYYPHIEHAYLDFAQGWPVRRVAYAPSFGTDTWEYTPRQTARCRDLLRCFDAVSVREASGVALCHDHLHAKAELMPDPTFLLQRSAYEALVTSAHTPQSAGDMMVYLLGNAKAKGWVDALARRHGLMPFSVIARTTEEQASLDDLTQPPLEAWLRGLMDARLVVTDSFHACVFSLIFGRPFVVIANSERGVARYKSLLGQFGLEHHLVEAGTEVDSLQPFQFDTSATEAVMCQLRERGRSFLAQALS